MQLTDHEKAMLDGRDGPAVQKAMDLLMRYGQALGAERLVETNNVCATITATTPFQRDLAFQGGGMDAVFSEFSLDSQQVVQIPKFKTFTSHLQLGFDPNQPEAGGILMTDSCSAMSRAVPKGTKTVALDSAKEAHYLPAILGVQAWFGTTEQCIDAACTGRWNGGYA